MFGGVQAVTWTDVKQMFLIVFGLVAAVIALIMGLPDRVGIGEALHDCRAPPAAADDRLQAST
jgi:Na+/proline symporter